MSDLSIFKLDTQTININDTTARQTADSAKTLATTASDNATTALNKINKLESEKADKTLATTSANGLMSAADKKAIDREFFRMLPKGGTHIPANVDLNSIEYLKVGNYYNSSDKETQTMNNAPSGNAFIMYVLSPLSEVYDNESTAKWVYRLRIFVEYHGNIFVQKVYSGSTAGSFTYYPWIKMTNSKDLSAVSNTINTHIANKSNPHGVTKAQVGLGNVDNTADSAKSVKYAASAGSANAVTWGNVSGKPSTYPPSSHTHTPAQVGLGNVANLDQSKAIKSITRNGTTFTATALDGTTTTFTQEVERTTEALNKINELEKLSRVSISYDSTKENMTITIGTHSVA